MAIYEYQCVDCGEHDLRAVLSDDYTAPCVRCGGLMLFTCEDAFEPYLEEIAIGPSLHSVAKAFNLFDVSNN